MSQIFPSSSARLVVVVNPDDGTQVRRITDNSWVGISSATFGQCTTLTTSSGANQLFALPAGLDAMRTYPILSYPSSATAFTDTRDFAVVAPEILPTANAIKAKTDNLPADPASETNATSNKNAIPGAVDTQLSGTHGTGSWASSTVSTVSAAAIWNYLTSSATTTGSLGKRIADYLDIPVSESGNTVGGSAPGSDAVAITSALTARAAETYVQSLLGTGVDSTGWTSFVFTVKASADDRDEEALLLVRVTNPANSGSDGLLRINGQATTHKEWASLAITDTAPNTAATLTCTPTAMNFTPTDSATYVWELTRFKTGVKESIGTGEFTLDRGLLRTTTSP